MQTIQPKSGKGFILKKGQKLKVIDIEGEQVSDFFCFLESDLSEYFSSGRTMDYLSSIFVGKETVLYSSKSRPLAQIKEDTVGRHDVLLTPCSCDTFRLIYKDDNPAIGCEGNLLNAFKEFGVKETCLPATFNIFMNVEIDKSGEIKVLAPKSKAGDYVVIEALEDIIVGLTACSALQSNNGSFKPIGYEIMD